MAHDPFLVLLHLVAQPVEPRFEPDMLARGQLHDWRMAGQLAQVTLGPGRIEALADRLAATPALPPYVPAREAPTAVTLMRDLSSACTLMLLPEIPVTPSPFM